MAEINNSIPSFGINIDKIEKKDPLLKNPKKENIENKPDSEYVPDTGVLGRSQVGISGKNIDKTVQEAVELATKHPEIMRCSESLFDSIYNDLIEGGMEPSTAYMRALMAEEEFLALGEAYNK